MSINKKLILFTSLVFFIIAVTVFIAFYVIVINVRKSNIARQEKVLLNEKKAKTKNLVEIAYSLIENNYNENPNITEEELSLKVRDSILRMKYDVRDETFNYVWIHNFEYFFVLHPFSSLDQTFHPNLMEKGVKNGSTGIMESLSSLIQSSYSLKNSSKEMKQKIESINDSIQSVNKLSEKSALGITEISNNINEILQAINIVKNSGNKNLENINLLESKINNFKTD